MVERVANENRALAVRSFPAVHEKEVLETVTVEIQERHTTAHGFNQKAVWRFPAEVAPRNTSLFCDISEDFLVRRGRRMLEKSQRCK